VSDLNRNLARHPRFRWAPDGIGRAYGMLTARQNRVLWAHDPDEVPFLRCSPHDEIRSESRPDLDDPGTVGALLVMLRAECRARHLTLVIEDDPRREYPEIRVTGPRVDLLPGPTAAFVQMPLGEAVATAILALWGPG
jgi:hypothetical protein